MYTCRSPHSCYSLITFVLFFSSCFTNQFNSSKVKIVSILQHGLSLFNRKYEFNMEMKVSTSYNIKYPIKRRTLRLSNGKHLRPKLYSLEFLEVSYFNFLWVMSIAETKWFCKELNKYQMICETIHKTLLSGIRN